LLKIGDPFWKTARDMLRFKRHLVVALLGAVISSVCFGSGLGMILPTLELLLGQKQSLGHLIERYLLQPSMPAAVQHFGAWAVERVPSDPYVAFLIVMATIGILTVIGSVGRYIHELLTLTVVARGAMSWRAKLFHRLIRVRMDEVMRRSTADHTSRIVGDTIRLAKGHNALMSKGVAKLFNGAAAMTVAIWLDWRLTLIASIGAPIIAILLRNFGKTIRRASKRLMRQAGRMVAKLTESLTNIRVVKVHHGEGYERRRFAQINRSLFDEEMQLRQARALTGPVIETLGLFGVMAVAGIAAWYIFRRNVPPEQFMTVMVALTAAASSLKPLSEINNDFNEASAAAARILEVMDIPVEPRPSESTRSHATLPRHKQSVRFENVSFTYPGQHRPAVNGVSLDVKFGQTIAIVGSNGSGKTSLLSLLPRLFDPSRGRILIDGVDVSTVSLKSLREQTAIVTQQNILFEGTIAENIAYARQYVPTQQILAASKAAYVDEFVAELPRGYSTKLGEGGEGLSGGQKQRICIARAVLRNPAILILDEATSQIDAESEAKITRALQTIRHGRTTFIIAHRLSTVIDSDLIVVMSDGTIIDQGKHADLLKRCDIYRALTQTQLQPIVPA
jgi:ABC-type multidrug transport system fused ATPase/permease subunit